MKIPLNDNILTSLHNTQATSCLKPGVTSRPEVAVIKTPQIYFKQTT